MVDTLTWFLAVSFTCGVGWALGTSIIDFLFVVLLPEDEDNGR